jgi:hypothetical protein
VAAGEGATEAADEPLRERTIAVEQRIEDGHLDPDSAPSRHGALDHGLQFAPAQPAGQPVINGRHDGIIERIAVNVDPEAVELGGNKALQGVRRRLLHPPLPQGRKVDHDDGGVLDALAASLGGLLGISPRQLDDVFVAD